MDAMSGRGQLGDWGLVADFYGLGGRAEYRTRWTGADGADSRADGADSIILDEADWADYKTGRTRADGADWWIGGLADGADYGILDGADWGGRGGLVD